MRKIASNTTSKNLTKKKRLTQEHIFPSHIINHAETKAFLQELIAMPFPKEQIIYALGSELVKGNKNPLLLDFLQENPYKNPDITFSKIPDEFDLLGATYQYLNTKYENLERGSFYTSKDLVVSMTKHMTFDNGETLIDLSCGSGIFLFGSNAPADRIFGVDFDPIAVMIAKFNFFIKFPDAENRPPIYQADFLDWYANNRDRRFTYVVGNPPYGANLNISQVKESVITTGESFSYFIKYGYSLLEKEGKLSYLLPESFLNVKRHVDIRDFVLEETNLTMIKRHPTRFAGVMSDIYQVDLDKKKNKNINFIMAEGEAYIIPKKSFYELKNHIFHPLTTIDLKIIEKIKLQSSTNFKSSTFGLGVVTGNNAEKLLDSPQDGTEPIFSGKELDKYRLTAAKKHIVFDRSKLQQVAPDAVYRAEEKLVYKVITTRLKVAIDLSKSLTTSSANIIVPKVPNNNVYSLSLLLNSDLYSFINQKLHGKVNKMSRENLEALPLPEFSSKELKRIEEKVKSFLEGEVSEEALQDIVYNLFKITKDEQDYIEKSLK